MSRKYDDDVPGGFVTWETIYQGEYGAPWVAWCDAREADGWEFCAARRKGRGKKQTSLVTFRRPASDVRSDSVTT